MSATQMLVVFFLPLVLGISISLLGVILLVFDTITARRFIPRWSLGYIVTLVVSLLVLYRAGTVPVERQPSQLRTEKVSLYAASLHELNRRLDQLQ